MSINSPIDYVLNICYKYQNTLQNDLNIRTNFITKPHRFTLQNITPKYPKYANRGLVSVIKLAKNGQK